MITQTHPSKEQLRAFRQTLRDGGLKEAFKIRFEHSPREGARNLIMSLHLADLLPTSLIPTVVEFAKNHSVLPQVSIKSPKTGVCLVMCL